MSVRKLTTIALALTLIGGAALADTAWHAGHARHRTAPYNHDVPVAAAHFEAPGEIVEQATVRARQSPGTTTEFDPTAKESATGGPAGGIPSSSGGP